MNSRVPILCLVLLLTVAAFAESRQLGVTGRVFDGSQALIAGASLSLTQGDKIVAEATTNETGAFELPAAAGEYLLQVWAAGFEPTLLSVQVSPEAAPLSVTLNVAAVQAVVTVQSERDMVTLDSDNNLTAVVLDEDAINALPDDEDALAAYLVELAGPRAAAAGGVEFAVDGFSGGRIPPKNQIQQIRINSNPYTAEFGRPGFGRIEIITKAGTGEFRGSTTFTFKDESLNARNALSESKPAFQQKNVQFNVGGPLLENKLSLNIFAQRNNQSSSDTIRAITLDGSFYDSFIRPSLRENYGVRGQYQTGENHTLNFAVQLGSNTRENVAVGGFSLLERGSTANSKQANVQLRQTGLLARNWIYETRAEFSKDYTLTTPNSEGFAVNVLDSFLSGGAQNRGEENSLGLLTGQTFMYNSGNVTLKTGVEWNVTKLRSLSENNYQGTYIFSSLAAYQAGTPTTFTITQGNPLIEFNTSRFAAFLQTDLKVGPKLVVSPGVRYQAQTGLSDYNNIAPRLSFAYSLDKSTVLRGGLGIFHQELNPNTIASVLRLDGTRQVQLVIRNPLFPDALSSGTVETLGTPSVRIMADDLAAPYTFNGSLSLEKAFQTGTVLTTTYDFIRGIQLYRSRDIDEGPANVYQLESSGLSAFHGMTFGLRQRMGAVNVNANYTYALSYNDTDGAFSLPASSLDLASEWGRAADDRRHQLTSGVTFSLPWDVSMSMMFRVQSGRPYNITTGLDDNGDTITNDRPAGVVRNSGDGPSFFDVGFNLSKTVRLSTNSIPVRQEGMPQGGGRPMPGGGGSGGPGGPPMGGGFGNVSGPSMTFFLNVQNLLNRTNYANYSGVLTSPYFGQANSALNPRELELGVRFNF